MAQTRTLEHNSNSNNNKDLYWIYCLWIQEWFLVWFYFTLEHRFVDEYDVSTHQLLALFTYWCHVCWLRFRRDKMVVDGRQMVSLVSVWCIWPPSLFSCASWIHGSVLQCSSWTLSVLWPGNDPTLVGLSRFVCSVNLWLSVLLVWWMYVWLLSMSHRTLSVHEKH